MHRSDATTAGHGIVFQPESESVRAREPQLRARLDAPPLRVAARQRARAVFRGQIRPWESRLSVRGGRGSMRCEVNREPSVVPWRECGPGGGAASSATFIATTAPRCCPWLGVPATHCGSSRGAAASGETSRELLARTFDVFAASLVVLQGRGARGPGADVVEGEAGRPLACVGSTKCSSRQGRNLRCSGGE